MKTLTIATFNCENLFMRYKFSKKLSEKQIAEAVKNGFILDTKKFEEIQDEERKLTAQAIKATKADIIALQEVENMDTLKSFVSRFLAGEKYAYKLVIDGNDPRLIDVALLSKIPFDSATTHQFVKSKNGRSYVFSRDCLEVNFKVEKKPFTLFINHFKSMMGGREETIARRKEQSEAVVKILKDKFGNNPGNADWAVLGDLNDYMPSKGLQPLIQNSWIEDVVETRMKNKDEQWTHWWDTSSVPENERYKHIDYILLSKKLAKKNPNAVPVIIRNGLATGAKKYTGARFNGVGLHRPAASDHCPLAISLGW